MVDQEVVVFKKEAVDRNAKALVAHTNLLEPGNIVATRNMDKPLLGLATTEELLNELQARMETTTREDQGALMLKVNCQMAKDMLLPSTLSYRTVDS